MGIRDANQQTGSAEEVWLQDETILEDKIEGDLRKCQAKDGDSIE